MVYTHLIKERIGKHPIGCSFEECYWDFTDPLDIFQGDEGSVVCDTHVDLGWGVVSS